ncbi:MAG: hypothetical protein IBJ18_12785 [Phycisphaerales bacterium]|nr:hypothetical protein [Phycisphaerales bacterium]
MENQSAAACDTSPTDNDRGADGTCVTGIRTAHEHHHADAKLSTKPRATNIAARFPFRKASDPLANSTDRCSRSTPATAIRNARFADTKTNHHTPPHAHAFIDINNGSIFTGNNTRLSSIGGELLQNSAPPENPGRRLPLCPCTARVSTDIACSGKPTRSIMSTLATHTNSASAPSRNGRGP